MSPAMLSIARPAAASALAPAPVSPAPVPGQRQEAGARDTAADAPRRLKRVRAYGARCPDCGGPLAFGEGCSLCPVCGYSGCRP